MTTRNDEIKAPAIPSDISGNGQELWNWAASMGNYTNKLHDVRLAQRKLDDAESRKCGLCCRWMHDDCPQEKHGSDGYKHGPSMDWPGCPLFVIKAWASERIGELRVKLKSEQEKLKLLQRR